ncbi:Hsp20 family protein [Roseovarius salis]|uniref:Hsp20/alpha crystallin family protein n=1 Tax=Roseovarius salis TaxID=3376063 RepID=UPI0037C6DA0F
MATDQETTPAPSEGKAGRSVAEQAWRPFWDLREEMERLFDDFATGRHLAPLRAPRRPAGTQPGGLGMPRLDVIDKADEVKLVADLPGMEESDIDVQVNDSTLTLSGEKKEETEKGDKEGDYYVCERRFGSFRRTVRIPEGIDHDKTDATFRNGVLTVRLPKKPEAQNRARKIEVKASK